MRVMMELQNGAKEKKKSDLNAQLRTHHANTSRAINKNTTMRTKLTNLSKMTT